MLRLPQEAKQFIAKEARLNGGSQNSEIIRCIRERMNKLDNELVPPPHLPLYLSESADSHE
jgi:hypothetical protein